MANITYVATYIYLCLIQAHMLWQNIATVHFIFSVQLLYCYHHKSDHFMLAADRKISTAIDTSKELFRISKQSETKG